MVGYSTKNLDGFTQSLQQTLVQFGCSTKHTVGFGLPTNTFHTFSILKNNWLYVVEGGFFSFNDNKWFLTE